MNGTHLCALLLLSSLAGCATQERTVNVLPTPDARVWRADGPIPVLSENPTPREVLDANTATLAELYQCRTIKNELLSLFKEP